MPERAGDELGALAGSQRPSGAFPSSVEHGSGQADDETCFVTATVALELGPVARDRAEVPPMLGRALDFVERCEWPDAPGAFAFYPPDGAGPRVAGRLPPDADDTALAWLALLDGGRRTAEAAVDAFERHIGGAALSAVPGHAPPWVRAGAVRTWILPRGRDNPVDLAVNANVASLAARIGASGHPAASGARASLLAAARGGYDPVAFARRLAPYYASACELRIAVARAVALGCADLAPCLSWLDGSHGGRDPLRPDKPLYCDQHGRPLWRSPALQLARRLAAAARARPEHGAA